MVGFLSGMFGVGGGFLMTPFDIYRCSPAVAVGTEANQVVADRCQGRWRTGGAATLTSGWGSFFW